MIFPLPKKYRIPALIAIILLLSIPAADLQDVSGQYSRFGPEYTDTGVRQGPNPEKIRPVLEERKIITSAGLFVLYARLRGDEARLKAGYYRFSDAMKPAEILRRMVAGEVYEQRFAVPEGYSVYQVAELLDGRRLFDREAFLKECFSRPLLRELGINGKSVEGYLYPSTYDIKPNMTAADLIRLMAGQFKKVYSREFAGLAQGSRLSQREIITLASMIEKEAVRPEEKPLIASVFYNRLARRMPLQSDPTSVYGVRAFSGNISKQDISHATPFNTYRISGLPPRPDRQPRQRAIDAALRPAATRYLYLRGEKERRPLLFRHP